MKQKLYQIIQYIRYLLKAKGAHSIHPPFLYNLYTQTIHTQKTYYCFKHIEAQRQTLLKNHSLISVSDLGAGSTINNKKQRKISQIAKNSLSSPKKAQLLFRLINHFHPYTILELGTSLGVNTLYLASYDKNTQIYTFEGCPNIISIAKTLWKNKTNIHTLTGDIDKTLPACIQQIDKLDMVYFDANHKLQPTIRYFETCLKKSTEKSIFIFDDIYWSKPMTDAWHTICTHPSITLSIDLFSLGIVFFDKNLSKQHLTLKF